MNAREYAFKILLSFEANRQHLDTLINSRLNIVSLSSKERKFVFNLVSGVVRHRTLFEWKTTSLYKGNYKKSSIKFKILLCLALYEIDFLDFIPPHATVNEYVNLAKKSLPTSNGSIINGILRTYLREGKGLDPVKRFKYTDTQLAIKYSFPEWLIKRWLGFWGEDFVRQMCESFNERPSFDVRVNTHKINVEAFENGLSEKKIDFVRSTYFNNVFKINDVQKLQQSRLLKEGYCTVQDESGLLAMQLTTIKAGDLVLDTCAAPGGKYTALLEKYHQQSVIVAQEIIGKRLIRLRENCQRLGFSDSMLVQGDGTESAFKPVFNHIIADVPCSGFGTIQKHPDIKWRRTFEEISMFQKLQLEILNNISKLLKQGGNLIYSTCTIEPAENEEVIKEFLSRQNGRFEIVTPPKFLETFIVESRYIRTFPHQHGMEGSFAVKLLKV